MANSDDLRRGMRGVSTGCCWPPEAPLAPFFGAALWGFGVGAVTGAIPPVIGWTASCGELGPGAVSLFALLFAWQLPHFLALAWMYRHDYAAGGFAMLPSRDPSGIATAQSSVLTSLLLVPVGLLPTLTGVAGIAYASIATVAGIWMSVRSAVFLRARTDLAARSLFLASLGYLPVVLGAMVLDRGSIVPTSRPAPGTTVIEVPAAPAPHPEELP